MAGGRSRRPKCRESSLSPHPHQYAHRLEVARPRATACTVRGVILVSILAHRHPLCHHVTRASSGHLGTAQQSLQGEACSSPPYGRTASAHLPFETHLGMFPTVTKGGLCLFPGARLPRLGELFLTTPTDLPSSQHPNLCPPRSQLCPARLGSIPGPLWCRCADTVPCHRLSCKGDQVGAGQAASQRPGPVLGEDTPQSYPQWH